MECDATLTPASHLAVGDRIYLGGQVHLITETDHYEGPYGPNIRIAVICEGGASDGAEFNIFPPARYHLPKETP